MISVIIVDDHPLVLNGFEFILAQHPEIQLLSTFTEGNYALAFMKTTPVDVVLLDINMPGMNGLELGELIQKQHPESKIIAISNINEGSIVNRMLEGGASGYLLKNVSSSELIEGIKSVMQGDRAVSSEIQDILKDSTGQLPKITGREMDVLRLMAKGHTTPQIAEQMFISPFTVETHRRNLLQKFEVSNAASLIHKATEMKFI